MARRGTKINVQYLVDFADHGTRELLAADRRVRSSVQQTARTASRASQEASRAAAQQVRESTRQVQSQHRVEQVNQRAARTARELASNTDRAATAARRDATATGQATAATRRSEQVNRTAARAGREVAAACQVNAREQRQVSVTTRQATRSMLEEDRAARQAARAQRQLATERGRAATQATRTARSSGAGALAGGLGAARSAAVGAVALGGFGLVQEGRNVVNFEQQIARTRAVIGGTEKDFRTLTQAALNWGAKTQFSAGQAAQGMYELGTSGFSAREILKTMPGTLSLAAASATDLGDAASAQAGVLRAFRLDVGQAGHVADVLTLAVNRSAIQMPDLVDSMKYAAPVARAFGQNLEDTAAAITIMGNVGIKGCYDRDTDVLTRCGYKRWEDVTEADEFATLNPDTGELEYQRATRLIRYRHTGPMYRVRNKNIDLKVTPDHRMWVRRRDHEKFEVLRAHELIGKSVEYQTGDLRWKGEDPATYTLPGRDQDRGTWTKRLEALDVDAAAWAEFIGYYLAEGCADHSRGGYRVQIHQLKGPSKDRIRACLRRLPFTFREYEKVFVATDEQLYRELAHLGHCHEKHVPAYAKEWSPRLLEGLLEAFRDGDGDSNGNLYTCSPQLADDLQELALKCGWSVSCIVDSKPGDAHKFADGRTITAKRTTWKIRVARRQTTPSFTTRIGPAHAARNTGGRCDVVEEWIDHDDEVFCAEVPNGLLIVRRGGRSIVSGNSQAGTTMRTALVRLTNPTNKAAGALQDLGLQVTDLQGPKGLLPMPQILAKVVAGAQGLSKSQRNAAVATIFGREALSGMIALIERGPGPLRKLSNEFTHSQGTAKRTAQIMRTTVTGAWDNFTGSIETAAISLSSKAMPTIRHSLNTGAGAVNDFANALLGKGGGSAAARAGGWVRDAAKTVARTVGDVINAVKPAAPFITQVLLPVLVDIGRVVGGVFLTSLKAALAVLHLFSSALGAIAHVVPTPALHLVAVLLAVWIARSSMVIGLTGKLGTAMKILTGPLRLAGALMSAMFNIGKGGAALGFLGRLKLAWGGVATAAKGAAVSEEAAAAAGGGGGGLFGRAKATGLATREIALAGGSSRIGAAGKGLFAGLGTLAKGALRAAGPLAIGASLVSGIVSGIQSKRADFGGKFQDFLHGATFGIIGKAGQSTAARIAEEYTKAINLGLAMAVKQAQHGAGFAALDRLMNRGRRVALSGGDILGNNPRTVTANFAELAQREQALQRQIARTQANVTRGGGALAAGRGAAANPVLGQLDTMKDELKRVQAAMQPILREAPKFIGIFQGRGDFQSLRQLRNALRAAGKDTSALDRQLRRAMNIARGATFNALTRDLGRGAARSIREIQNVMRQAQTSMRSRGLRQGDADFARAQENLARAAAKNIRQLIRSHVITAQQGSKEIKRIYRDLQITTGRNSKDAAKAGVKGLDDMVRGWRDGWSKAGHITDAGVKRIGDTLAKMPTAARKQAAQAMVLMARQLAASGKIPQKEADRLLLLLHRRFGAELGNIDKPVKAPLKRIAQLLASLKNPANTAGGALGNVRRTIDGLSTAIPNVLNPIKSLRGAFASIKSSIDNAASAVSNFITNLGNIPATPSPGKHPGTQVVPARRRGGRVAIGAAALAFAAGGLVPIAAAGGEVAVYPNGMASMIPGDPRSDSTVMAVPPGTAIVTGHGQQLMAGGASLNSALAMQMPHFAKGGRVHLSPGRLAGLAEAHGVRGHRATIAGAVASAESTGNSGAVGDGGQSIGFWQIYMPAHPQYSRSRLFDPDYNANAMRGVSNGGSTWSPWTMFRNGGYRKFMARAAHHVPWKGHAVSGGGKGGGGGGGGGTTTKTVLDLHAMSAREARKTLPHLLSQLQGGSFHTGYEAGLEGASGLGAISSELYSALRIPTRQITVKTKGGGGGRGGKGGGSAPGFRSRNVPRRVIAAARTASAIAKRHLPYTWGGGHGSFSGSPGYDCSGYVSAILHAGGWLGSPVTTDGLKGFGSSGAGKWITVGVRGTTGRSAHTMIRIGRGYWESGGRGGGGGPHRWNGWDGGFPIKRHPRGYRAGGIVGQLQQLPKFQPELFDPQSPLFVGWGFRSGGLVGYAGGGVISGTGSGQGVGSITFPQPRGPRWITWSGTGTGQGTGSTGAIDPTRTPPHRPATSVMGIIRELERAGARANAAATAALKRLVRAVDGAHHWSIHTIEGIEKRIRNEIRHLARGGLSVAEQVKVRRLRGALSALESVIGARVGRAIAALETARAQTLDERRTRRVDQALRIKGIDPAGFAGQQVLGEFLTYQRKELNRQQKALRAQLAIARRHHDSAAVKDIKDRLHQMGLDVEETAVQIIENQRDTIRAQAQEAVSNAQYSGDVTQAQYEGLQIRQQLAGMDTNSVQAAQERSDFITSSIIPALQAQAQALSGEWSTLIQTNGQDSPEVQQAYLAMLAKQNEIAQAQLDAQNQIKDATEQTAENTKDFGGSLGYEFGGTAWTDLIRAGSGA